MQDSYCLITTALSQLKENAETATYFKYELGLHYFLESQWEMALKVFKGIAAQCLPQKFFQTQIMEVQGLAKTLKVSVNFISAKCEEEIENVPIDKMCILPCPAQLTIKIACCYFNMNQYELGMKWLLSIIIIHKKYSNFQSKAEEEIYQLVLKYLNRSSMKMLTYESCYFMKHLLKLPDEKLITIQEELKEYRESLIQNHLKIKKGFMDNFEASYIGDYLSSSLIILASHFLMGETQQACRIFENAELYMLKASEQNNYLVHHLEYWMGRALMEERRLDEAREVLKSSMRKKNCVLNISNKVKIVLSDVEFKRSGTT